MSAQNTMNLVKEPQDNSTATFHDRCRAQLASELLEICSQDVEASAALLLDQTLLSLSDVALRYYCTENGTPHSSLQNLQDPSAFRSELLYRVPTAVLAAVVSKGHLEIESSLQQQVATVLSLAIEEDFDIRNGSLGKLILSPRYGNKTKPESRPEVRKLLETLQRLQNLVVDAEDIKYLLGTSFISASSIASVSYDSFLETMLARKMPEEKIPAVHNEATKILRRNEQLWIDIIGARSQVPILALNSLETRSAQKPEDNTAVQDVNLTSLFNDLDIVESDDSTSVLSPAAYLVDLLQFLKNSKDNALAKFLQRRPDIQHIELSKENTETHVPYLDLVIEVMEAHVHHSLAGEKQQTTAAVGNNTVADASEKGSKTDLPGKPMPDIYSKAIGRRLTPMSYFPYNDAITCTRELLRNRGFTRYELLELFSSGPPDGLLIAGNHALSSAVNERRLAAERLGLQPADFVAITQEGYQTKAFINEKRARNANIVDKSYEQLVGTTSCAEYWGYTSDKEGPSATEKMLSGASRLALVKDQLMPRSGLTTTELDKILKTRFIGRRLVMTVEKNEEYSERLGDLRLQDSGIDSSTDTSSTGNLSVKTLQDLQAFIRLWRKLRWSIEETDTAVCTLATRSKLPKPSEDPNFYYILNGDLLEQLAGVSKLSDLTSTPVCELLPLWGSIDAHSPDSLYSKLFLKPNLLTQFPLLALDDARLTLADATFNHNLEPLLRACRITHQESLDILSLLGMNLSTRWSLESVAQVYAHSKMRTILALSVTQYCRWLKSCLNRFDPLLDPQSTFVAVQSWLELQYHLPPNASAMETLHDSNSTLPPSIEDLTFIKHLMQGISAISTRLDPMLASDNPANDSQIFTSEELLSLSSNVFGAPAADNVVKLVEGTLSQDCKMSTPFLEKLPSGLSTKAIQINKSCIRLSGILRSDEVQAAYSLATRDDLWASSVSRYFENVQDVVRTMATRLSLSAQELVDKFHQPTTFMSNAADREQAQVARRKVALLSLLPRLKEQSVQDLINAALAARFPGHQINDLRDLLEGPNTTNQRRADLSALLLKSYEWTKQKTSISNAWIFPPNTAEYTFTCDNKSITLNMLQRQIPFSVASQAKWSTAPIALKQDQAYNVTLDGNGVQIGQLTYFTAQGGSQGITAAFMCPDTEVKELSKILHDLQKSLQAANTFGLNAEEALYHQREGIDLSRLDVIQMSQLGSYVQCRKIVSAKSQLSLVRYLQVVGALASNLQDTHDDLQTLTQQSAALLGSSVEEVTTYLASKWPAANSHESASLLLDAKRILDMSRALHMARSLGVSVGFLFDCAKQPLIPTWDEDFEFAMTLRQALEPTASPKATGDINDAIKSQRQLALQQHLLHTKLFGNDLKITTVDGLFAYFLIDVKMGPQLKTSRIGQAIATAQLFIQRCLLGLEKSNNIRTTAIDQSRWNWMQKYNLWVANRKVFLYPENWADPALRDNKTQPFQQLESKVLQSNLTIDSINQMVREYIYTVNDIADLEVQSYLWEAVKGFRGRYHFFARTRTAPFIFYYRQLQVLGASAASIQWHWHPWTKMEVEIPSYEIDGDGSTLDKPGTYLVPALFNERLFLFIPDIIKKTVSAPKEADTVFQSLANEKPKDRKPLEYWEIKMAWTELRSGKWSLKQVTETGIECGRPPPAAPGQPPQPSQLPPIAQFKFRLDSRATPSGNILGIRVERWEAIPTEPAHANIIPVGSFEMQGPRMRPGIGKLGESSRIANIQTNFSRFSHKTSAKADIDLQKEVGTYMIGPNTRDMRPLLAVPAVDAKDSSNRLTWLLAFDDSQYAGASGLVVEKLSESKVESFFGFPDISNDGKIDLSVKTTVNNDSLTHDVARALMETATFTENLDSIFSTLEHVPGGMTSLAFGSTGPTYHELAKPYSIYNWELGFHAVSLIVERLLTTQQFDLAIQLSRQVFDPTRDDITEQDISTQRSTSPGSMADEDLKPMSRLERCWRFPPFKSSELRNKGSVKDLIQRLAPGSNTSTEISQWAANPFSPHSVARQRPSVYMKRFIRKYIEVLIASGDQYFRQPSLEAIPLAIQRYLEASQLFGPAPQSMKRPTKPVTKSFFQITDLVNDFASAAVDMELEFPFYVNPASRVAPSKTQRFQNGTVGFVTTTYFSVPANPELRELRELLDTRFFNIRNGLDIHGNPRTLPLFDPPLDVGQLVVGTATGLSPMNILESASGPMPNYRSTYLLQKAIELCNELKGFSESFLSIKEKRDGEAMAALRARQDIAVQNWTTDIKEMQIGESRKALESLQYTRKSLVSRLKYYLDLTGESSDLIPTSTSEWKEIQQSIETPTKDDLKMSSQESLEMSQTEEAARLASSAATSEHIAAGLLVVPEVTVQAQPMGVGMSTAVGVRHIAQGMMCRAAVVRTDSQKATEAASRAGRTAQLVRQLQERRLLANQAGYEISNNDKQIAVHKMSIERSEAELRLQKQQAAYAVETEEYLRTKYTSEKLYSWMESSVRKMFYQTYLAAFDMAKAAERAFAFEYGKSKAPLFLTNSYWDDARDGLLAAQNLHLALRRIESYYINTSTHDYELSKVISLRQINPVALLSLRATGTAEFTIPEVLFDHDFPGHYCRRIKRVSISIPCVVGPYTTISCTARLVEHRYRLKPGPTSSPLEYYEDDNGGSAGGDRFHRDRIPVTAIALSSAQQDVGAFELSFQDERYSPFEGAGVISRWHLELPAPYRQFNYDTISDVVVTMHYTSLEGGTSWKNLAAQAVRGHRTQEQTKATDEGLVALLDVKNEAPNSWAGFRSEVAAAATTTVTNTTTVNDKPGAGTLASQPPVSCTLVLPHLSAVLPYWTKGQHVSLRRLWVIADAAAASSNPTWLQDTITSKTSLMGTGLIPSKELSLGDLAVLANDPAMTLDLPMTEEPLQLVLPKKALNNCWVLVEYTVGN